MMRKCLRPLIRKMGYDVVRHDSNRRFPPMLRTKWMNDTGALIVLDIGANVGDYVREVREHGFKQRVISVEPVTATYEKLKASLASDPNWIGIHAAAGPANGKTMINISANTVSSSVLAMEDVHLKAAPASAYVSREEVDLLALDLLVGKEIPAGAKVWLKMDVQGYEFSVLEGAKELLKQTVGIEIELSMQQMYTGTPLLAEALQKLDAMGFMPVMLSELFCDPETKYCIAIDGIFLRK